MEFCISAGPASRSAALAVRNIQMASIVRPLPVQNANGNTRLLFRTRARRTAIDRPQYDGLPIKVPKPKRIGFKVYSLFHFL